LSSFTDDDGYINLKIEKANSEKEAVTTFTNYQQAKSVVYKITETNQLCQKLTGLYKTQSSCFLYEIKECYGACINEESADQYNERVKTFIEQNSYSKKNMLIIDIGRAVDEHSVILIEDGVYRGFGFYNLNFQINSPEILKSIIMPMDNNRDAQHIIQSYLRRKKVKKIVFLDTE
jgi:DNA polymerase-3 subunit epsilon